MLKINNKLKLPLIISAFGISGAFLFQYLTYVPEYSSAAPISTDTPVTITPTTPLAKWDDLQYMQQMTPQACASATEGQSKPLIDNRDTSKSYTVTKLKGNVGCWMTENMDYDGGFRVHHGNTYGGYYTWVNAKIVCDFTGWELPTKEQYDTLLSTYSIGNNAAGSTVLRGMPFNFVYGGYYYGSPVDTNNNGRYWSSTPNGNNAYGLRLSDISASTDSYNTSLGQSVRCVAKTTSDVTPVDPSAGGNTGINDPNVSVTVPNIITLDVSDSVDIATESNVVNTGNFIAKVESSKDYTISLNAVSDDIDATSLVNYKDGNKVGEIPTIVNNNTQPQPGISSWGIMLCNNTNKESCTNNYLPLPTKNPNPDTINPFVTGTKGTHQHLFQIGIGIGPELPSGTYTTSIQVTASQK